ncbi:MAG: response regulator [Ginsengibacter sp.]
MIIGNNYLNILVVEDNPGDFLLMEEYLRLSQLPINKVNHAADMSSARALKEEAKYDIALLDLSLPDSSGIDSVKNLNRLFPDCPIIVLSGMSSIEVAIDSISVGAQDYLVKGEFNEKMLAKSIQYSIERKKTLQNLQLSHELYEIVSKATNDILWDWNILKDNFKMNDNARDLFGYPTENLQLNFFFDHIHPIDVDRVRNSLFYHLENKVRSWQEEYLLRTTSGLYKDVLDRGFILFDEEGNPYRMIGSITDQSERKTLERKLYEQKLNQQRVITEVTIKAQEKERDELGKELHDNVNQILATVKMYLSIMKSNQELNDNLLESSFEYVNEAIEELRKLSKTLATPTLGDTSLRQALENILHDYNISNEFHVNLEYEISDEIKIDNKKELTIYRIIQEQLNNIRKHSMAQYAKIILKDINGNLSLSIVDNGIGFDTSKSANGIGLQNIRSRLEFYSGNMNIVSSPGNGCELEITMPYLYD